MKRSTLCMAGLFLLAISACGEQLAPLTPPTQTVPAQPTIGLAPTLIVSPAASVVPLPTTTSVTPYPVPATNLAPATAPPPVATPFTVPMSWAERHLEGRLIFTAGLQGVLELDLATGTVTTVFQGAATDTSWVLAAAVPHAGRPVVMAYVPPATVGDSQFGYPTLFEVTDGGPVPVLDQTVAGAAYFDVTWSPDGRWLYYVRVNPPQTQTDSYHYSIDRLSYPGGQPVEIVQDAFWPRVSADGEQMVYVHYDPVTGRWTRRCFRPTASTSCLAPSCRLAL
jgi:hypothetical protein